MMIMLPGLDHHSPTLVGIGGRADRQASNVLGPFAARKYISHLGIPEMLQGQSSPGLIKSEAFAIVIADNRLL